MIGWMSFALLMARGFKLSSAKRMGPTVVFPLVLYIICSWFWARALFNGSVASRKRMLDIGSPCPDPVQTVMRIPFFPFTST